MLGASSPKTTGSSQSALVLWRAGCRRRGGSTRSLDPSVSIGSAYVLLDDGKNLAVAGLNERREFLIVRLKLLVAHHRRRGSFKRGETRRCQFQDERIERAGDIRQNTRGKGRTCLLLDRDAFLHESDSLASLSKLQAEHISDDDHKQPPANPVMWDENRSTKLAGTTTLPRGK
jgi:hypothetical protein